MIALDKTAHERTRPIIGKKCYAIASSTINDISPIARVKHLLLTRALAGSRKCRGCDNSKIQIMLGHLIANLDRPGVAVAVLQTLDPILAAQIEKRAAAESMTPTDFVTGAVRVATAP
jgi:hypothetical protein